VVIHSDLFGPAWRGSKVKSTPMPQAKSNALYLDRKNSYLYRLARHFGSNWRECRASPNRSLVVKLGRNWDKTNV